MRRKEAKECLHSQTQTNVRDDVETQGIIPILEANQWKMGKNGVKMRSQ